MNNAYQIHKDIVDHYMHILDYSTFRVLVNLYIETASLEGQSPIWDIDLCKKAGVTEETLYRALVIINNHIPLKIYTNPEGFGTLVAIDHSNEPDSETTERFLEDHFRKELEIELRQQEFLEKIQEAKGEDGRLRQTGYIYLVKDKELWKIGKAKDYRSRIDSHITSNPNISVAHIFRSHDYDKREADLHVAFKEKRIKGEWFNLNDVDVEIIMKMADNKSFKFVETMELK